MECLGLAWQYEIPKGATVPFAKMNGSIHSSSIKEKLFMGHSVDCEFYCCGECDCGFGYTPKLEALVNEPTVFEDERTPAFIFCDERDIAVFDLTVITPRGEFTAENVREDSIKFVDGTLTCEDTANDAKLFTFFDVIGYYNG